MTRTRNVAILIFDEVEVLDFAGPFEVFSITGRQKQQTPFNVYTVAETAGPILARNQLSVNPRYAFADCPPPDILVVPGGWETRREMNNAALIDWIKTCNTQAGVCTLDYPIDPKTGLLKDFGLTQLKRIAEAVKNCPKLNW